MNQIRALQLAVAVAGFVPVTAGAVGAWQPQLLSLGAGTHGAYLSGLLLGVGLGFWSLIPNIAKRRHAFSLLAAIVVLGGLARLLLAARLGAWPLSVTVPLVMELGVMPALWLWQRRVASPSLSSPE